MRWLAEIVLIGVVGLWCVEGCDEEPDLPPRTADTTTRPAPPGIDVRHKASIQADRHLTLANMVLVIQGDPADANSLAVSLVTSRPAEDGSRMAIGTFARARAVGELVDQEIHLSSVPVLSESASSIRTTLAMYQPKAAILRITAISGQEVTGEFSGEFYRFQALQPAKRPETVSVKATFTALLITK